MSAPIRLELEDRMATGGDGIGRLPDGRIVMVDGALPGETVLAEVVRDRRDHARAAVTRIERPSPHRIPPPCPHHRRGCGGCPWMEVDPDAQVALKQRMALEALARLGRVEPVVVLPPVRAATSGYRTTLHLAVDGDGRPGFRRRHRATPVAVDSCLVAHPSLAVVLDELRLPGRDRAALRVGTADGARLLVLPRPGPRPIGLPDDVSVVEPGATASIHEDVGGRRWRVSARSFFQAGPSAAEAILAAVATALGDAVGPGDVLVDAYAGVGVLGGSMAARLGTRLVSVESDPGASSDATENLADLDARVERTEVGRWTPRSAQAVIADPARTGLGRPGVASLVATGAGRLVLVSCDPASAARDAALLAAEGYRLETLQVVDTFARTVHVEVVCRYDRIGAGRS